MIISKSKKQPTETFIRIYVFLHRFLYA